MSTLQGITLHRQAECNSSTGRDLNMRSPLALSRGRAGRLLRLPIPVLQSDKTVRLVHEARACMRVQLGLTGQ